MRQINKFIVIVTALLSSVFSTSYQQEKWTLDKCINYALENNIQIKQQEIDTRTRSASLWQSKLDLLPSINANFNQNYSLGRALDQTTYTFTEDQTIMSNYFSVNSSVTLFNGLQKINTIKQNKFNLLASLKDLEKFENDITLNICASYLQILLSIELLDAANGQLAVTEQQVERTGKLVKAGSLPQGSLLEIQAQAAAEELQVVNAQNQLELAYLTLIQLLELDTISDFEIDIPEISIIPEDVFNISIQNIFYTAQSALPQIKSAEYKLRSAEHSLNIAKGYRSPNLSLSGTYSSGYSDSRQKKTDQETVTIPIGETVSGEVVQSTTQIPVFGTYAFSDQFRDNASTGISLVVSVPILNGWQANNYVSNAKLNILNSKYQLEYSKNMLFKEIQQAYADAKASLKRYKASEKALVAMEESFKYTKQRFEVGLVNIVDYNSAKNQLRNTKSELIQSKFDYIFKTKILDFYQGKPLNLGN